MRYRIIFLWFASVALSLMCPDEGAAGIRDRLRSRRGKCCTDSRRAEPTPTWHSLFDGQTLGDWKATQFGGQGDVEVRDGNLFLDFGYSLTGVTYTGPLPLTNYEMRLEAMKVDGIDFFCAWTFPVGDAHCSFVVGGWAGSVVGLSSIDDQDASQNDTTRYMVFEKERWYRIRVRVEPERIQCWIDDERVVDQDLRQRRIGTRIEMDLSKPMGIAAWETQAALRNIELRRLERE